MTAQLDLFADSGQSKLPGHRYQLIGICQCSLRANDSASGMFGSVDRMGVLAAFAMTPAAHAEHLTELLLAGSAP